MKAFFHTKHEFSNTHTKFHALYFATRGKVPQTTTPLLFKGYFLLLIFFLSCSGCKYLSWFWLCKGKSFFLNNSLLKNVFSKNRTTTRTLLDETPTVTLIPTLRPTSTLALLRQRLYRTSEASLKLSHVYYNLTCSTQTDTHFKTTTYNYC